MSKQTLSHFAADISTWSQVVTHCDLYHSRFRSVCISTV